MSNRGENLALFREQITPRGASMPKSLFWFVIGVGVGLAAADAWEPGVAWWEFVGFGLTVGALFGLLFCIPVWVAWVVLIQPITDWITTRRMCRRYEEHGIETTGTVVRSSVNVSGTASIRVVWESAATGVSTLRYLSNSAFGFPPTVPDENETVPLMYLLSDPHSTAIPIGKDELDVKTLKLRQQSVVR